MALKDKSLFLYGFEVNSTNQYLPFKISGGGSEIDAIIPSGFYTLSTLATAIATAMNAADLTNTYTVTIDRTFSSNLQNRVTIATSGAFLSLLFSSGTVASTSIYATIGFAANDYTGATSYQNSLTSGTALETSWYGNNYQGPLTNLKTIGSVNMSANGTKEGIWWSVQELIQVEFKYEAQATVLASWNPMLTWMIKQRPFEFTPEVSTPNTVYSCTLDKSSGDGKGLGFLMKEMLPDFPFMHTTGPMEFRLLAGTY